VTVGRVVNVIGQRTPLQPVVIDFPSGPRDVTSRRCIEVSKSRPARLKRPDYGQQSVKMSVYMAPWRLGMTSRSQKT